ncbi:hypothetical protein SOM26_01730 [Sphingomonas sp. CFBP8993]|uniref:hypothetical protein n=1 Tax=Sphingomonas sp. CFBP8993 TaxID=3096526 RepID=UPI002A6A910A|nr:hypothetical protein [Sphingomonas sp. CFBP8993]MDY0957399.1 hypothetical protein [Sphingomonas sp. CFBP8993]
MADRFTGFVAIDWSGAHGTAHPGIRMAYCANGRSAPVLVPRPGRAWSRQGVADWLLARADEPLLVGFDFSFSAPFVERGAHLPGDTPTPDARSLWAHVDDSCDDPDLGARSFLDARRGRHFYFGAADGRKADFLHWRRCEVAADGGRKPSTVYDAIGASQVAKASFAGMRMLRRLDGRIAIWPFDAVPAGGMLVVEIYTTIAARDAGRPRGRSKMRSGEALDDALAHLGSDRHRPLSRYDDHSTDAILTSAWLRTVADRADLWRPAGLTPQVAQTEGWTFGVS